MTMLSAFKNFLVTFLVAALIFGLLAYFTAGYVSGIVSGILDGEKDNLEDIISNAPAETDESDDEPNPVDPDLKVPEGNSFTFLVVGTDYRPDIFKNYYHTYEDLDKLVEGLDTPESTVGILGTKVRYINATWIMLVRADKENREYVSCYISPETKVNTPTGDTTLGDVYGRYGMDILVEYLEAMTDLKLDYTFIVDGIHGAEFLSSMGSVKFELECDIYNGGKYHISASTSVETILVTESVPDESESASSESETPEPADEPEEADNEEPTEDGQSSEENSDDPEELPYETEIIENNLVLKSGEQNLSDYSVHIINTFKEMSGEDIGIKSKFLFDILEGYLRKCADWSEEELTEKMKELAREKNYYLEDDSWIDPETLPIVNGTFEDPYSSKPVLATNLTAETVGEIYSMLEAIEYFEYTEYVYPGSYSDTEKMYIPDTQAALDFFSKYVQK